MGLEWAHAELLGQGEGLAVVGFGQGDIWGMAVQRDLTKQPVGPTPDCRVPCGHGRAPGARSARRCASSTRPARR